MDQAPSHRSTSRLPTNGLDHTMLENDIPVMVVSWLNRSAMNFPRIDLADSSHEKIKPTFENYSPTLLEFLNAQWTNTYRNRAPSSHSTGTEYRWENHKSTLSSRTDADSIIRRILNLTYHSLLAGYLGKRRMYDSLRHEICWPIW